MANASRTRKGSSAVATMRSQLWEKVRAETDEVFSNPDTGACLISLVSHLVILISIALFRPYSPPDNSITIVAPVEETEEAPIEAVPDSTDFAVADEILPEIGAANMALLEAAAPPPPGDILINAESIEAESSLDFGADIRLADMFANDSKVMIEEMAGVQGATVAANGDSGSVERITEEILAHLDDSPVLVAWLMDASDSLRSRRQQIIERFDRVYAELDELVDERDDLLLTSVYAFGKTLTPMLDEPTSDREQIQESVREIETDETGVENVFSAIKSVAMATSKYARKGRKVMIVVVTDERGDDLPALGDALEMVKVHKMVVYVMGPAAPFGREKIQVQWIDRDTGEIYMPFVDIGPETVSIEHASLPIWRKGPGTAILSSGFGPYGLTRVTHENGGLYLLGSTDRLEGPEFEVHKLSAYHPDYVNPSAYLQQAGKSPLRTAILRTAKSTNELVSQPLQSRFYSGGIQFEIRGVRKKIEAVSTMLNRCIGEASSVEKLRTKELSGRWTAHYDLLMGRLLANQIRCLSFRGLLEEMYTKPKMPKDGTKNAWELVGDTKTALVNMEPDPDTADQPIEMARRYLQRVIDEHPETPWAYIAERELGFPLAFEWQEAFMEPPPGEKLPWDKVPWDELTEAQKTAKAAYDKRKAARKARPKPAAGAAKRPPPKL